MPRRSIDHITLHQFTRGGGWGGYGRLVGYRLECTHCWNAWKVNGNKREARQDAREHECPQPRIVLDTEYAGRHIELRAVASANSRTQCRDLVAGDHLVILIDGEYRGVVISRFDQDNALVYQVIRPKSARHAFYAQSLEEVGDAIAEIAAP